MRASGVIAVKRVSTAAIVSSARVTTSSAFAVSATKRFGEYLVYDPEAVQIIGC